MSLHSVRSLAVVFVLLAVASCRISPIYNVENAVITPPEGATIEDVDKAIVQAGAQLGWQVTKQAPGQLIGRLPIRSHVAVVDITHSMNEVSITYRDSTNLRYDPATNEIHTNYNSWIKNLQNAIFIQVSTI